MLVLMTIYFQFFTEPVQPPVETEEVLSEYTDETKQLNWWPEFIRQVLGRESKMDRSKVSTGDPVYRKAAMD